MSDTAAERLKEAGLAHFRRGDYQEAQDSFEAAVQAFADQEDKAGQAEMLNNIGVIQYRQKHYEAAAAVLNEARAAFTELGDGDRQAQAAGNLGDVSAAQGRYKQAAEYYSEAAQLFARVGEKRKQADVLRAYSLMALRRRQVVSSITLMTESLRVRPRRSIGQHLFYLMLRFVLRLMAGG